MKFTPLTSASLDQAALRAEYAQARQIGKLRLGGERLYFRSGLRVYAVPYADIRRYFRRVMRVPAKLCCGHGDFEIEHLVLCGEDGELAQIGLPGAKAARAVMDAMARLAPEAAAGAPPAQTARDEEDRHGS